MSKISQNLTTLRDHTDDELRTQLATTRDELFRLQLGQYTNQVSSTAAMTTKRRNIARILTLLNARKLGTEQQGKGAAQGTSTAEASSEAAPAKKSRKTKAK